MIRRVLLLSTALMLASAADSWHVLAAGPQQTPVGSRIALSSSASAERELLNRYCVTCHNERLKTAGLMLEKMDVASVAVDAEAWERVVRKLGAGVMPPAGRPRPDRAALDSLRSSLETRLDRVAAANPNAGRTETFHRLNRAEYQNATRDLLAIDVDVASLLPGDDASYGFDNIAGVLRFSPALMERYLAVAKIISRAAVGTPPPSPNFDVFRMPDDLPQEERLEGLPLGTRGGTLIHYNFPTDGEYLIRVRLARQLNSQDLDVPRFGEPQELEVSVDGERLQVFTLDASEAISSDPDGRRGTALQQEYLRITQSPPQQPNQKQPQLEQRSVIPAPIQQPDSKPATSRAAEAPGRGGYGGRAPRSGLDADWQVRVPVKAGPHAIAVTFLNSTRALRGMLVKPYLSPNPPGSNQWTSRKGAYLGQVEVSGPFGNAGVGNTPSRRRIFVCHPTNPANETPCAKTILTTLARRAFRRPTTATDARQLLVPYLEARKEGGAFEDGIERAIQRVLVSPEFLFRTEADPGNTASTGRNYRVNDLELASRLSFFLWSSIPDDELLKVAEQGKLKDPVVFERQVRRMLGDSRSKAIVDNFVGQWLFLRNIPSIAADPYKDPDFDESLRQALKRETELFLDGIIRDDRSVLELLTANYTFLNERLAKHYGIPNVYGSHFRRVMLPEGSQRGWLLGQGSILAVTSYGNRTSPVRRGKWILENILGTPPPSPPPDVPALDEKQKGNAALTMRERMVAHRANPVCASCHQVMDPLGFALENFDQAGRWRAVDDGVDSRQSGFSPIDTSGVLPDGNEFNGPTGLRQALVSRSDQFMTTVTEKLLTYALGRGLEYYDQPTVRAIVREARRNDYHFSSLVTGITNSIPFQMRRSARDNH